MLVIDSWASVSVTVGAVIEVTVRLSPSGSLSGVPPVITLPAASGVPDVAVWIAPSVAAKVLIVAVGHH